MTKLKIDFEITSFNKSCNKLLFIYLYFFVNVYCVLFCIIYYHFLLCTNLFMNSIFTRISVSEEHTFRNFNKHIVHFNKTCNDLERTCALMREIDMKILNFKKVFSSFSKFITSINTIILMFVINLLKLENSFLKFNTFISIFLNFTRFP